MYVPGQVACVFKTRHLDSLSAATMNGQKLNANAFEFKPRFNIPQQAPQPPPERPAEDAPAPPPAPTISLNIGGPKPAQPAPSLAQPVPQPAAPKPAAAVKPPTRPSTPPPAPAAAAAAPARAAGQSTTFTLERAANDAAAIQREAQDLVDQETLEDLYGKDEPIDEGGTDPLLPAC